MQGQQQKSPKSHHHRRHNHNHSSHRHNNSNHHQETERSPLLGEHEHDFSVRRDLWGPALLVLTVLFVVAGCLEGTFDETFQGVSRFEKNHVQVKKEDGSSAAPSFKCDEIMVGVFQGTCLIHAGSTVQEGNQQGMSSFLMAGLPDGSMFVKRNDGQEFWYEYEELQVDPTDYANATHNCIARTLNRHYKSFKEDKDWHEQKETQEEFTFNTLDPKVDFLASSPTKWSCRFVRLDGQECKAQFKELVSDFVDLHVSGAGLLWNNHAEKLCTRP